METAGKPRTTVAVRVLALFCYTVAAIVMFTSHQHVHAQSSNLTVKYDEWDGFRLFATVNIIGGVYNLLVPCIGAGSPLWKTVIVLDVIMNLVVGAILGAGWPTYFLIKKGNKLWFPVCGVAPIFCNKILGSLITSTIGFFINFLLLIYILHVSVDPFLVRK